MNGVKHIKSSVYHPCSNGGAERFVQTIKQGLNAIHIGTGDAHQKLSNYLFRYRSTPSTTTGKTPAELFLGREVRTRLNLFKQKLPTETNDTALVDKMHKYSEAVRERKRGRREPRCFSPNQQVLIANHIGKPKWLNGKIIRKITDRTYSILIGHREVKRHVDDIIVDRSGHSDKDDSSWMFVPTERAQNVRTRNGRQSRKVYPRRDRRPVDRFGLVPFT